MKTLLLIRFAVITVLFLIPSISNAQFEFAIGYQNSSPSGAMSTFITQPSHGFSVDLAYRIPSTNLSFGTQISQSNYGHERREDTYRFDNGYEGTVNVDITNIHGNASLYLKYDLLKDVFAMPYLIAGGGISHFSTDLSIMDPREEFTSDCPKPLETSTLVSDQTGHLFLGGGMRFDFSYVFKSLERRNVLFDFRVTYLDGGEVRYMSMNAPGGVVLPGSSENVLFDFASAAQPDIIHEYHAGSSYRTKMQMLTINLGLTLVPGKWDWSWFE